MEAAVNILYIHTRTHTHTHTPPSPTFCGKGRWGKVVLKRRYTEYICMYVFSLRGLVSVFLEHHKNKLVLEKILVKI